MLSSGCDPPWAHDRRRSASVVDAYGCAQIPPSLHVLGNLINTVERTDTFAHRFLLSRGWSAGDYRGSLYIRSWYT
jgi:hypothetical protein